MLEEMCHILADLSEVCTGECQCAGCDALLKTLSVIDKVGQVWRILRQGLMLDVCYAAKVNPLVSRKREMHLKSANAQ